MLPPGKNDLSRFADRHLRLRLPFNTFLDLLVFGGSREGTFDACYWAVLLTPVLFGIVICCLAYELVEIKLRVHESREQESCCGQPDC